MAVDVEVDAGPIIAVAGIGALALGIYYVLKDFRLPNVDVDLSLGIPNAIGDMNPIPKLDARGNAPHQNIFGGHVPENRGGILGSASRGLGAILDFINPAGMGGRAPWGQYHIPTATPTTPALGPTQGIGGTISGQVAPFGTVDRFNAIGGPALWP